MRVNKHIIFKLTTPTMLRPDYYCQKYSWNVNKLLYVQLRVSVSPAANLWMCVWWLVLGFSFIGRSCFSPYASSSKPMPTLCPPALKFFPSIRADRVTFTPANTNLWIISGNPTKLLSCTNVVLTKILQDACSCCCRPTWPQALGVSYSNQAGIVHFGLQGVTTWDMKPNSRMFVRIVSVLKYKRETYRQRGIFVQLVFSSDAKASVVTSSCPGQSDGCLQLIVHLLVDGPSKLSPIVTERRENQRQIKVKPIVLLFWASIKFNISKMQSKMFSLGLGEAWSLEFSICPARVSITPIMYVIIYVCVITCSEN